MEDKNLEKIHTVKEWKNKRSGMVYRVSVSRVWISTAIAEKYLEGVLIEQEFGALYTMTYDAFLAHFEPVED